MKIIIYFALIVAFLMFYQSNPVYTIFIVAIVLGTYLFYRSRRGNRGNSRGAFRFLSGNDNPQNDNMDDLITLMMIQQLFSPAPNPEYHGYQLSNTRRKDEESEIDKIKREVLELLGDD
jgi:hypothetical protein